MKISDHGLELIKEFESLHLTAYWDKHGKVWTIGWGSTAGVTKGMKITVTDAEARLERDVSYASAFIEKHVHVPLTQGQFDALVSIIFNVGPGNATRSGIIQLKEGGPSTLLRRLNAGDYLGAAIAFKDWVYSGGTKLKGLERRREAEFQLFMGSGHGHT